MQHAQYPSLDGRNVLITGGASGIGADLVTAFTQQGCCVSFFDIKDDAATDLVEKLDGQDGPVHYQRCDLSNTNSIQAAVESIVEKVGPLSVLVNNAGNDDRRAVSEIDAHYWEWSQRINVQAQFFMAQAVLPSMKTLNNGSIINLSSIAWRLGIQELVSYSAAKAGILGLTNSLAAELGQYNIRVNAIEPGAVMTDKQRTLWYPTEKDVKRMIDRQKLNRAITGDDIARTALFLASDDSAMITGQSLRVDAGFQ